VQIESQQKLMVEGLATPQLKESKEYMIMESYVHAKQWRLVSLISKPIEPSQS